jgi:hypothetical protein
MMVINTRNSEQDNIIVLTVVSLNLLCVSIRLHHHQVVSVIYLRLLKCFLICVHITNYIHINIITNFYVLLCH